MTGRTIGPYEVLAKLGEGGMGEVYRARDTKLHRDVAIKVLPDVFAGDRDRFARFTREAQTLAALNHPNIAQIYGFEETGGVRALVIELVEGEDLSGHIARAKMPLSDVLSIARQIADALEAAHERDIVHRDLKPANVKVRPDGTVKVLDFGLAKTSGPGGGPANDSTSPTVTAAATERGVILGTAAYMAPEQARGQAVDKRADIWAFGAVVYEMLTGTRAFAGQSMTDVLAAVLRQDIDWSRLPADTPPRLRQLLERCLERDVKQRLRDIGEARVAIDAIVRDGPRQAAVDPLVGAPRARSRERIAWSVAALAVLAAAGLFALQRMGALGPASSAGVASDVARLSVLAPPGLAMNPDSTNIAISPNGRLVVFVVGVGVSTENQMWVRAIDSQVAHRIEAGDGVSQPFWSPDSEHIGFFADRKLKAVALAGGPADVLCDAPFGRGAAWSASNVIVFAPDATGPLYRVSANGGPSVALTTLDAARKELGHRYPLFLPDGDHFLYAALPGTGGTADIFAGSLRDQGLKTLIGSMESAPAYAEPGWLLFTRGGVLAAQPFDAKALRTTGEAVSLGDEPSVAPGPAAYDAGRRVSASTTGSLAYFLAPAVNTTLQWMDQSGKMTSVIGVPAGRYTGLAIAPDNTHAVLDRRDSGTSSSLWLVDLTLATAAPLATAVHRTPSPVWSPDSRRIVFVSNRDGRRALHELAVAESTSERPFGQIGNDSAIPRSWSHDQIMINMIEPDSKWNVYRLPPTGAGAPVPIVRGPAIEVGGWLSPDGHWLAYLSDETGRLDVWVQAFPAAGQKLLIPTGGTELCWWARDGRHLLFVNRDKTLWQVDFDPGATAPHIVAPKQLAAFPPNLVSMDLAADGQRFLALVPERAGVGSVTVVQSWRAALAKR
ncbi:MAG TPA: protein kinase [Vicinamibacterales bacterium]|nr:protein kinase [Vicinamibacterales bacterium]